MFNTIKTILLVWGCLGCGWVYGAPQQVTGEQLVAQCKIKHPGDDQRSRLTVVLKDELGNEKKNVYRRFWKGYNKDNGLTEKMMLFTVYPPDAKGAAFMRWGYEQTKRKAQQWIFLPSLKKIRRVTVRDLADSFLGSDLTYADITPRRLDADEHKILGRRQINNATYAVVASIPKDNDYLYSKRVHWFRLGASAENCVVARTDYFDRKGQLLKKQYYEWQKVKDAWIWRKVYVENVQSLHSSMFTVDHVAINVGINDDYFDERSLRGRRFSGDASRDGFAFH